MSAEYENDGAFNEKLIEEVLAAYPEKFAKRRRKHLTVAKAAGEEEAAAEDGEVVSECEVKSNIKSIPGVMTIRGCAYAGSKGVVWGPVKDMVHISHGPVGCGQYSWSQRRNYYIGTTGIDTFVTMQFTSDFKEKDIVFGGDKKLDKVINEIEGSVPAQSRRHHPIGMSDRPDRRRHRGSRQEEKQGNRQDHRAGALRRLPRRVAVARPPHRQRFDPRLGVRQERGRARRRTL